MNPQFGREWVLHCCHICFNFKGPREFNLLKKSADDQIVTNDFNRKFWGTRRYIQVISSQTAGQNQNGDQLVKRETEYDPLTPPGEFALMNE